MHPITNYLRIIETKLAAYKQLAQYHYIKSPVTFIRKVYAIVPCHYFEPKFPEIIAVIVYSPPHAALKARNRAINDLQNFCGTRSERQKFTNDNFSYISRIIVDPRFRRLGLANWLLEHTLPLQNFPYIETLTPIDFTNSMFVKHGFELHHNEAPEPFRKFELALQQAGITGSQLTMPTEAQKRIDCLDQMTRKIFDYELHRFLNQYKRERLKTNPLHRITYALSKFPYPYCYLLKRENFKDKEPIVSKSHQTEVIQRSNHRAESQEPESREPRATEPRAESHRAESHKTQSREPQNTEPRAIKHRAESRERYKSHRAKSQEPESREP